MPDYDISILDTQHFSLNGILVDLVRARWWVENECTLPDHAYIKVQSLEKTIERCVEDPSLLEDEDYCLRVFLYVAILTVYGFDVDERAFYPSPSKHHFHRVPLKSYKGEFAGYGVYWGGYGLGFDQYPIAGKTEP